MMLRRKPLRDAYTEGYATGLSGAPPDPGRTEHYGPEIDWCRNAGWHDGHRAFMDAVTQFRNAALGFDAEKAR